MKKLLTYISLLFLVISCSTNKQMSISDVKSINPEGNAKKSNTIAVPVQLNVPQANVVKTADAKPVVLKRMMRRPAVI